MDWFASAKLWMNVQPYGSPLFVLIGHLMNLIAPNNLPLIMTVVMNVLPASIAVATTYLIVKKLTTSKLALVSVLVLLGSALYVTQSTILDEFAISSMFVTLAFYFYIQDKKKLTVLMLALGSAIQIIVIAISVLWFIVHVTQLKKWWHTFWIYLVVGLLPYAMVLILMYLPTPRLLAGHLSLAGIDNYLGATGTVGSLSLYQAPQRLLQFLQIMCISLGFAIVPMIVGLKGIFKQPLYILLGLITICFVLWLYLTDSDPATWHFLPIAYPLIMIFVALGLNKLSQTHLKVVFVGAVVLVLVNSFFLNANVLNNQYPLATDYEKSVESLPDGSYLICNSGGEYGLANYYVMAQGKKFLPLFYSSTTPDLATMLQLTKQQNKVSDKDAQKIALEKYSGSVLSPRYLDYIKWAKLDGKDTIEQTKNLLAQGKQIFIVDKTVTPYWYGVFQTEPYDKFISKVTGVNK
jgi:hypothetical protein